MTKFLVTGQADLWSVFWFLATMSATYLIAAITLREILANPQSMLEKYGLWFGRIVGLVGAAIIFAYSYSTTSKLDRVEHECERYKALAAAKANGVDHDTVAEISVDTGRCVVSWLDGQSAFTTSVAVGSRESSGRVRPLQRPVRGQSESESTRFQCGFDRSTASGGVVSKLPDSEQRCSERF